MAVRPAVSYIPCDTSSKEVTDYIIKLTQFEEGNLVSETHENSESDGKSGDESKDDSIMPPLLSVEEIYEINSGDDSDDEYISTEMIEYIHDVSQYHQNVDRREARYKILDLIKQG